MPGAEWQLVVGEELNPGANTCKTCFSIEPTSQPNVEGQTATGRCRNWPEPVDVAGEAIPVLETSTGLVIVIDLTTEMVGSINATFDDETVISIEPYRLPLSGKRYAAFEVPSTTTNVRIDLIDGGGTIHSTWTLTDPAMPDEPPS